MAARGGQVFVSVADEADVPAQADRVWDVRAGVVTERAMEHATERGLVFATDPTSAWACTIGTVPPAVSATVLNAIPPPCARPVRPADLSRFC